MILETISLVFLSLGVGFFSALLGLGGNVFIIPLLPLIYDISTIESISTGILSVFFITSLNSFYFYRDGLIDFKFAAILFFPTFIFSFLGAFIRTSLHENVIHIMMLGVFLLMLLRLNFSLSLDRHQFLKIQSKSLVILILVSSFTGIIAGVTGVGNGLILVPLLLSSSFIDHKKVSPTINLMIAISCFSSTVQVLLSHEVSTKKWSMVHLDLALFIFIFSTLSAIVGRNLNKRIDQKLRKKIVSIILIFLIAKTLSVLNF